MVDAGAVPLLVNCIQEPEISLKRISASALSDISKHSTELAKSVVDAGAIAYLAVLVENPDAKLKRQVFSALSQVIFFLHLACPLETPIVLPSLCPPLQQCICHRTFPL